MTEPTTKEREIACEILRAVFIYELGAVGKLNDLESVERIAKILAMHRAEQLLDREGSTQQKMPNLVAARGETTRHNL